MENVTQGYTQHNGTYAKSHQRKLPLQHIHDGQAKECAKDHGQQQQGNGCPASQTDGKQQQNEDERQCYTTHQVMLNGAGIIITAGWCAMKTDLNFGMSHGKAVNQFVQHNKQP